GASRIALVYEVDPPCEGAWRQGRGPKRSSRSAHSSKQPLTSSGSKRLPRRSSARRAAKSARSTQPSSPVMRAPERASSRQSPEEAGGEEGSASAYSCAWRERSRSPVVVGGERERGWAVGRGGGDGLAVGRGG